MRVISEIPIRLVNGESMDAETLYVTSSDRRRGAVDLRIAGQEKTITVDADELHAAINNAVNRP